MTLNAVEDNVSKQFRAFSNHLDPFIGPDGKPVKTSVCDDIEESVKRAADIEKQLKDSKVFFPPEYIVFL